MRWTHKLFPLITRSRSVRRPRLVTPRLCLEPLEARTVLSFLPPVPYRVGDFPVAVVVGDFNGDGNLDIATTNNNRRTVKGLLGNGHGSFRPPVHYDARENHPAPRVGHLP